MNLHVVMTGVRSILSVKWCFVLNVVEQDYEGEMWYSAIEHSSKRGVSMRKPQSTVVEVWDALVEAHVTHISDPHHAKSAKRKIVSLEKELKQLTHRHCDLMLRAALAKAQRVVKGEQS